MKKYFIIFFSLCILIILTGKVSEDLTLGIEDFLMLLGEKEVPRA